MAVKLLKLNEQSILAITKARLTFAIPSLPLPCLVPCSDSQTTTTTTTTVLHLLATLMVTKEEVTVAAMVVSH